MDAGRDGAVEVGPPRPAPGRLRLHHLDGVRGLAASYVVLHHVWLTAWPRYPEGGGPGYLEWLAHGQVAVAVFIVVSGFSLALAPARHGQRLVGGTWTFLVRRGWRILPPYWAALALSAVVYGLLTPDLTGSMITVRSLLVHGALLQDVVDSPKPNGAFWSIAVEWQIYFLFPLVLLVLRRAGGVRTAVLATAAVVVVQLLATSVPALEPATNLTPQFLALFVMGVTAAGCAVAAADDARTRARLRALSRAGAGVLLAACGTAALLGTGWVDRQYFWVDLVAGAGVALVLGGLATAGPSALRTLLSSRPVAGLGTFSYSVYLVHLPLIWIVYHAVVARWELRGQGLFWALLALGVPVVLLGSRLFFLAVERPVLHRRERATGPTAAAVP